MPAEIEMTEDEDAQAEDADDHLQGIEDGAGCTEIWEHLSERRTPDADDD